MGNTKALFSAVHDYWRTVRRALWSLFSFRRALKTPQTFGENGAGSSTRTRDPLITNQVLFQLSYAGPRRGQGPPDGRNISPRRPPIKPCPALRSSPQAPRSGQSPAPQRGGARQSRPDRGLLPAHAAPRKALETEHAREFSQKKSKKMKKDC